MHFTWLIFLFLNRGHSMWGWLKRSTQGVPHWAAHRMSSLLCLLKIRLFFLFFFFINISQAPQEKPWRWIACQLMDGDGDGIRTFKTNMENGASWTRPCAHTHTHTHTPRAPMCCDLDPPQEGCFDWPTEICDGLQNTLDAKGESCQEHRGMFYL